MQSDPGQVKYKGLINCAKETITKEGFRTLYNGGIARGIYITFSATIMNYLSNKLTQAIRKNNLE